MAVCIITQYVKSWMENTIPKSTFFICVRHICTDSANTVSCEKTKKCKKSTQANWYRLFCICEKSMGLGSDS